MVHFEIQKKKTSRLVFLRSAYKYPFLFPNLLNLFVSLSHPQETQHSLAALPTQKESEEYNKCKDIIDHYAIKNLRFESDSSASHQILVPLFKKPVPTPITNLLRDHCLTPLRQGFEWSKWDMSKPQGAWPSTTATWAAWVDRMEKFFSQEWRALGIYDAIKSLDGGNGHGPRASYGGLELLVFGHQHHGSPSWAYWPYHP